MFIEKFKLLDHLTAFKSYLLLGRGDFADQLMEALGYAFLLPILDLRLTLFLQTESLEVCQHPIQT